MNTKETPAPLDPQVKKTLIAVIVGALAVLFDTTIVSVALHTIAEALDAAVGQVQWVSTGYLLALAIVIPISGWAQRAIGGKRLWLIALTIFLVGSIASSLSWNLPSLIAFRVVQGVGGGIMLPLMSTIVMQAAQGKSLGRVMGVVALPSALGPIIGPVIGGLILTHLHWSWLFWVNIPFCVAGFILAWKYLPADTFQQHPKLDVVGFALLGPGLAALLFGLSRTGTDGGLNHLDAVLPLAAGTVLMIAFVWWSLHPRPGEAEMTGQRPPLVNLRLLKHWSLASSSLLMLLCNVALYGAMLLLPLYFQQLRGLSPLTAGLLMIPQGVGTFASRSLAGRLTDRVGPRLVVLVGFGLATAATIPFAMATGSTNEVWLLAVLFVRGLGLGAVTVPLMATAYRGIGHDDMPDASIVNRIAGQVGGTFGTAVLAVVLNHSLTASTSDAAADSIGSFQKAFWWSIALAALGLALSFLLPGKAKPAAAA